MGFLSIYKKPNLDDYSPRKCLKKKKKKSNGAVSCAIRARLRDREREEKKKMVFVHAFFGGLKNLGQVISFRRMTVL